MHWRVLVHNVSQNSHFPTTNCDWSRNNHATVTLESSGRLSRNEIKNLQRKQNRTVKRKCWKSQVSFLSSEQPCEPKSLDVALNIAGVEKIRSEKYLRLRSTLEAIRFELVTVEICVLRAVVGDSQISLILSETPYSCDTVGREL